MTTTSAWTTEGEPTGRGGAVGAWRDAFIGVGNGVETASGLVADTFETAITWDRWPEFDAVVRERVSAVLRQVFGHEPLLSCRFTHVYPDGPAPYYTWSGIGRQGSEIAMWTGGEAGGGGRGGRRRRHHHPPPRRRAHAPPAGYDRQRPDLFADALRAAKRTLDPGGVLNPGVLIDP